LARSNLLNDLLGKRIAPRLKDLDFHRFGMSFERRTQEVILVVNFQRSVRETGCERFTVNLGVGSQRLFAFEDRRKTARTPIELCHWRIRLGRTAESPGDSWWELCEETDVDRVGDEVTMLLEYRGLPVLNEIGSDASLRAQWAEGKAAGITELQRLQFLAVLLDDPGLKAQQRVVVEELKEFGRRKGLMGAVGAHLEALGLE
jgi:hypothetical protein